ncbi:MAG: hypothetical protein L3K23_06160 [Thermoplasmata archaeon]|nr:hypothetical protein [Thermoplasmata archaeon]
MTLAGNEFTIDWNREPFRATLDVVEQGFQAAVGNEFPRQLEDLELPTRDQFDSAFRLARRGLSKAADARMSLNREINRSGFFADVSGDRPYRVGQSRVPAPSTSLLLVRDYTEGLGSDVRSASAAALLLGNPTRAEPIRAAVRRMGKSTEKAIFEYLRFAQGQSLKSQGGLRPVDLRGSRLFVYPIIGWFTDPLIAGGKMLLDESLRLSHTSIAEPILREYLDGDDTRIIAFDARGDGYVSDSTALRLTRLASEQKYRSRIWRPRNFGRIFQAVDHRMLIGSPDRSLWVTWYDSGEGWFTISLIVGGDLRMPQLDGQLELIKLELGQPLAEGAGFSKRFVPLLSFLKRSRALAT